MGWLRLVEYYIFVNVLLQFRLVEIQQFVNIWKHIKVENWCRI